MNTETIRISLTFLILCLAQALVLNNIHLFGIATPLLYILLALNLRRGYSKAGILAWCFSLGLLTDMFADTPGVATCSLTFIGFIQPYLLELFVPRDSADDLLPSFKTLGTAPYIYYTVILTLAYSLLFFSLEMFSFFNLLLWAECVAGSAALTVLLVLAIERVRRR